MAERFCRCEATIPASVLEGFACGTPDCWRTEPVRESFDAFVADLLRARGETPPEPPKNPVITSR